MGAMAETRRRGATTGPGGGPRGEPPDTVPDHLPFARAASVIAVVALAGTSSVTTRGSFQAPSSAAEHRLQEASKVHSWCNLLPVWPVKPTSRPFPPCARRRSMKRLPQSAAAGRLGRSIRSVALGRLRSKPTPCADVRADPSCLNAGVLSIAYLEHRAASGCAGVA
jgi:hypothetical protein